MAHAAAELASSDTSDLSSVPASLTSQQLEELAQLRRTVTSLHEELDVLRSMNTELQNEIESMVRRTFMLVLHVGGVTSPNNGCEGDLTHPLSFVDETLMCDHSNESY